MNEHYKEMWEDAFYDNLEKREEISKLKAENARLKAEAKRLREGVETMTYSVSGVEATTWVRAIEYDRLKRERDGFRDAVYRMRGIIRKLEAGRQGVLNNACINSDNDYASNKHYKESTACPHIRHPLMKCLNCVGEEIRNNK